MDTERPPSTRKPVRRGTRSNDKHVTPTLYRDGPRVHVSPQPQTPPLSQKGKEKDHQDIDFDLSDLGLVDREIPPGEITKLEKIGSGGFKE